MSVTLLGFLLLTVSLVSVLIYMVALGQILVNEHQQGMVRTAVCRLLAALLYVGVGLLTIQTHEKGPLVGLGVFTVVQLMWQFNSIADLLLVRRRKVVPVAEHSVSGGGDFEPTPNFASKLPDAVVSAEIDRLSNKATELSNDFARVTALYATSSRAKYLGFGALIFVGILALIALIFALFTFNKSANADTLANVNSVKIDDLKKTQLRLDATVAKLDITVTQFCDFHSIILGTYSTKARDASPGGPTAYDSLYRRLFRDSEALNCKLTPPKDFPY